MEAVTHSQEYILGHILYIWSFDMYAYVQTQRKKKAGGGGEHRGNAKGIIFRNQPPLKTSN